MKGLRTTASRRRRTDDPSPLRAAAAGLVALAVLTAGLVVAIRAPDGAPGVPYKTVYATVPDIGNLQSHSEVRVAGKRIGQIMDTAPSGGDVRLELQLLPNAGHVPSDSTVVVRSQGLLGQRYLQVRPGVSDTPVAEGGTLAPARTAITLGIPEMLQTFDRETRGGVRRMLDGLGDGMLGRGRELNEAIADSPEAASDFRTIAHAVTADPAAARRLLPELSRAAASFSGAREPAAEMLEPAHRALSPFVDRRDAAKSMVTEAASAFEVAGPAFVEGRALLASARQLSRAIGRTMPAAPPALRETSTLLREARRPLARIRPLLARARTAVPAAVEITRSVSPVLRPLREPLDDLVEPLRIIGAHGCDVTSFAQTWRSFLGFGIPNGSKIGPLGEIRSEALYDQRPISDQGEAVRPPEAFAERDLYPKPCDYRPSIYSSSDPTG